MFIGESHRKEDTTAVHERRCPRRRRDLTCASHRGLAVRDRTHHPYPRSKSFGIVAAASPRASARVTWLKRFGDDSSKSEDTTPRFASNLLCLSGTHISTRHVCLQRGARNTKYLTRRRPTS
jgi:hypothetical protein